MAPSDNIRDAAEALAPEEEEPAAPSPQVSAPKPNEVLEGPNTFTFYDVFFWRDAPDWYRKTFFSAGFGLCYCVLKQYLNRHELEVFMPPRSKILPETMQKGYRNSQMLKYGFLKVGGEITTIAGAAATYYAGAYYLGRFRDGVHSWENFAASGAVAGAGVALWLIRPLKARPVAFGVLLGSLLGGSAASVQQAAGLPFWDESHDFEGWFLGSRINLKKKPEPQAPETSSTEPLAASSSPSSTTTGMNQSATVDGGLSQGTVAAQPGQGLAAKQGSGAGGTKDRGWWPWSRGGQAPVGGVS